MTAYRVTVSLGQHYLDQAASASTALADGLPSTWSPRRFPHQRPAAILAG